VIVGDAFGFGEDGEWIPTERAVSEHVQLDKAMFGHADRKEQTGENRKYPQITRFSRRFL